MQPLFCLRMIGSASHVDDAVEVGVDHRLEAFRAQLLERRYIAVAGIVDDDIKTPEAVDRHLHSGMGRSFIGYIESSGADVAAVFLHQIMKALRIAGRCDQIVAPDSRTASATLRPRPPALP